MEAAIVEAPRKCRMVEVALPEPGPSQVRIKLEGSGICASDLPVWEGRPWFEYPLPPGNPGHEGWGRIDAVGSEVHGLKEGDRVSAFLMNAYAEVALGEADDVVVLPDELNQMPFPGEPLACAMNAFARCGINSGDDVAIVGGGFQGQLLTQLVAGIGARPVVISQRSSALDLAVKMGAEKTILWDEYFRARDELLDHTAGQGYPCVIECTGHQTPLNLAAEISATRGRLVVVGYHQEAREVNMQLWNWRGLDVINAHERDPKRYVAGMRRAVEAVLAGKLTPQPLLTHTFALQDLAEALETAGERREGYLKGLVLNGTNGT